MISICLWTRYVTKRNGNNAATTVLMPALGNAPLPLCNQQLFYRPSGQPVSGNPSVPSISHEAGILDPVKARRPLTLSAATAVAGKKISREGSLWFRFPCTVKKKKFAWIKKSRSSSASYCVVSVLFLVPTSQTANSRQTRWLLEHSLRIPTRLVCFPNSPTPTPWLPLAGRKTSTLPSRPSWETSFQSSTQRLPAQE